MNNSLEPEQPNSNDRGKQERTSQMQRKVLEHLSESGNISYACKRAGISRETFYKWRQDDKVFAQDATLAVSYGKSFVNDLAHTQLILNIQKGDMKAVRFQLVSCHDDYKPRRARAPEESIEYPAPVTAINIFPARPRSPSPSPSAPLKRDVKKPKPPTSTVARLKPPVPKQEEPRILTPREWKELYGDDGYDFEIDRRDLLGPR